MRRALAVTCTETRRDDARVRQHERGARPAAFQPRRARVRPDIYYARVFEKIVDVPEAFLVAPPEMPRDTRAQPVQRAADVEVVATRKFERA